MESPAAESTARIAGRMVPAWDAPEQTVDSARRPFRSVTATLRLGVDVSMASMRMTMGAVVDRRRRLAWGILSGAVGGLDGSGRLQGDVEDLLHLLHRNEFDLSLDLFGDFGQIVLVFFRDDHGPDAGPQGAQGLFLAGRRWAAPGPAG